MPAVNTSSVTSLWSNGSNLLISIRLCWVTRLSLVWQVGWGQIMLLLAVRFLSSFCQVTCAVSSLLKNSGSNRCLVGKNSALLERITATAHISKRIQEQCAIQRGCVQVAQYQCSNMFGKFTIYSSCCPTMCVQPLLAVSSRKSRTRIDAPSATKAPGRPGQMSCSSENLG